MDFRELNVPCSSLRQDLTKKDLKGELKDDL